MALPEFSMRQLLEAGAHFGHRQQRWNPKMAPYIYGAAQRHPHLDLTQTVPLLHQALVALRDVAAARRPHPVRRHQAPGVRADRRRRQALRPVLREPSLAGRHAHQLADHHPIPSSACARSKRRLIRRRASGLTKKELLGLLREQDKLERSLGGIKEMGGLPNMLFVIDTNKEAIAIAEARKLGIPVTAILDSNSDPDGIAYPIPGNDDAARAIALYCDLAARAIIDGLGQSQIEAGVDIGAAEEIEDTSSQCRSARRKRAPDSRIAARAVPRGLEWRLKWRTSPRAW